MRRDIFIAICLVLILAVSITVWAIDVQPDAHRIHVAKDGNDANTGIAYYNGISYKKTIGSAITACPAGGTIQVEAGTYAENVTLNKQIHLVGASRGAVTVGTSSGDALVISSPYCKVENIIAQATGTDANGISIRSMGNTLIDCNGVGTNCGIEMNPQSNYSNTLIDCIGKGKLWGVYLSHSSYCKIQNLLGRAFPSDSNSTGIGIYLYGGLGNTIDNITGVAEQMGTSSKNITAIGIYINAFAGSLNNVRGWGQAVVSEAAEPNMTVVGIKTSLLNPLYIEPVKFTNINATARLRLDYGYHGSVSKGYGVYITDDSHIVVDGGVINGGYWYDVDWDINYPYTDIYTSSDSTVLYVNSYLSWGTTSGNVTNLSPNIDANVTAIKAKTDLMTFAADGDLKAWDPNL